MKEILRVEQLTKAYGTKVAIVDVSVSVRAGSIVGLIGPNGAGKTTTLGVITGTLAPTKGDVMVTGQSISHNPLGAKRQFAYVPDSQDVIEDLTPRELIGFMGAIYGVPKEEAERRGLKFLEIFEILGCADNLMREFSHGMKKKAQLAAALCTKPALLILDEPTSGLDPVMIALLKDLLRELSGQKMAVLVATHNLPWAQEICDEIYLIHQGRIVTSGHTCDVLRSLQADTLEEAFIKVVGGAKWREIIREAVGNL